MDLNELLKSLNPKRGLIHPVYFEAYCDANGYLDAGYISSVVDRRLTQAGLNSQVNTMFGSATFMPLDVPELEHISEKEFRRVYYQFGSHKSVRDYIMAVFEDSGKIITRDNLFKWVQNY